jgi:predicted  nucleic acid-binding Zn-ribbon protein
LDAQIKLLRQLQEYDLEIYEITQTTDRLRETLDDLSGAYDSLKTTLDAQKAQLDDTRKLMRDKEIELEENNERYKSSKDKLNQVANTKQYNALEKELDTYKKLRVQLEEERDTLRENLEAFQVDVNDKEKKIASLQAQITEEQAAIDRESAEGEVRIVKLETERDKLRDAIPKPIIRQYEFIQSRRPGAAVVAAINGTCTGCNMKMPPQLFNELQISSKLIKCPNCQRILFFQASGDGAGATA